MLEEVIRLTPDVEGDDDLFSASVCELVPTNPPIMIPVIGVDGNLYPVEKIKVHAEGLHHLALSVFVFDGDELLIQRRALHKYHCGGQWANTCCTHPFMDEDIERAAKRRLNEELGFTLPLKKKMIVDYSANVGDGLWERERVHMFRADIAKEDLKLDLNPDEVSETRWITPNELRDDMARRPEHYTPWFRIYVERFPSLDF